MKISLVGMSGIGKSFWSTQLAQRGFVHFCCDALIENRLGHELQALGYAGIHDMARWLGQPYDPQYAKNSQQYLHYEQETLTEILAALKNLPHENVVIDTTGSVIYLTAETLRKLQEQTVVVYLTAPAQVTEKMYELYKQEPKPVMWGDKFCTHSGETLQQALARCYRDLLSYRSKKYAEIAAITIDYDVLHAPGFQVDNFLRIITAFKDNL
jgi:shikimate kinase